MQAQDSSIEEAAQGNLSVLWWLDIAKHRRHSRAMLLLQQCIAQPLTQPPNNAANNTAAPGLKQVSTCVGTDHSCRCP